MSPLTYIIGWPLCAAILLLLVPRTFRPVVRAVAILATFISALLALKMFLQFKAGAARLPVRAAGSLGDALWASATTSAWTASTSA